MADMTIYLDAAEVEFVKSKPKGWVRGLVRRAMEEASPKPQPRPAFSGHCPVCGDSIRFSGQPHNCKGTP